MRPFIGVICWQRRSASYLHLELRPRRAVRSCVPASILTSSSELELLFFTYKSTEFFSCMVMVKAVSCCWLAGMRRGGLCSLCYNMCPQSQWYLLHLAGSISTCLSKISLAYKYVVYFLWPKDVVLSMSLEDLTACWALNPSISLILVFPCCLSL